MSSVVTMGLLLGLLTGPSQAITPAGPQFERGRVLEHIPSDVVPGQRYTLYLPTGFDRDRPTPILYLMDPRGRASVPVRVFQAAAERFGYILISSHTSTSDGPMEPNLRAMQSMWDDSQQWFTVDRRRVYVAGFSGTARMASLLAHTHPDIITGVIGVGAGFDAGVSPSTAPPFPYFAAIGDVDYNFHELETLERALVARDWPHRIERFAGPHSWMHPEAAMRAVEWLELRAMQSGARPRDPSLVDAWWTRDDTTARELADRARVLDAARTYAAMTRDFAGLRDTGGVRAQASQLASSPEGAAQRRSRETLTRRSAAWLKDALQAIADAYPQGVRAPRMPIDRLALALELAPMKKTIAAGASDASLEAQRRLNELAVQLGFYLPHDALSRSDFDRAGYYLSLATLIDDASPVTWYLTAQRWALLKVPEQSLTALQRAADAGFRDLALLETDASFQFLRATPGYLAVAARLRTHAADPDPLTVDRPPVHVRR